MAKVKIKNTEIFHDATGRTPDFPKYTTQLMNLANSNAQGTRPKVVGQMSDLIQEYGGKNYDEWAVWYLKKHPDAIDKATLKILDMIENFKAIIQQIDKKMIRQWTEDLVLAKTFAGLCFQESILKKISSQKNTTYRLATPEEEAMGVDGYIGNTAVSIKPDTYKTKAMYGEQIDAIIIYYSKKPDGITVEFDF